jgi:hypothetical protein
MNSGGVVPVDPAEAGPAGLGPGEGPALQPTLEIRLLPEPDYFCVPLA